MRERAMQSEQTRESRKSVIGFAVAIMVGAAVAMLITSASSLLESGVEAPPFELAAADGERRVSLESLRGKVVLLDFWSTSCPPCIRQMRDLEVVRDQISEEDLVILGINTEGAPLTLVRDFARERGVSYPMLVDGAAVSTLYRVEQLPTLYIIDREGRIRWSRTGFVGHEALIAQLREVI
jgi:peroxiredoxin